MKKLLFLHIGMHKTGTSAIQKLLSDNYDKLLAQGVLYPKEARLWENHNTIAWHYVEKALFGPYDPEPVIRLGAEFSWNLFYNEIESTNADRIVLSCEDFSLIRDPGVLAPHLVDFDVSVIVYLRRQDRYYQSLYNQDVRHEDFQSTDTLEQFLAKDRVAFVSDYKVLLDRWARSVGKERIFARVYDRFTGRTSLFEDFAKIVGFSPVDLTMPDEPVNQSLPAPDIQLLRMLNHAKRSVEEQRSLVESFRATLAERYPEGEGLEQGGMTPAQARTLMERFEKSNRLVAREYFGESDGALFPPVSMEEYDNDVVSVGLGSEAEKILSGQAAPIINHLLTQIDALRQEWQRQHAYIFELEKERSEGKNEAKIEPPKPVLDKKALTPLTRMLLPMPDTAQEDLNLYSMVNFAPIYLPILELLQPEAIVEIGSEKGGNTSLLGRYCIEHHTRYFIVDTHPNIDEELAENPLITYSRTRSIDFLKSFSGANVYFIDGDHNYQTVKRELELINDNHESGPLCLIMHDSGWPWGYRDLYYDVNTLDEPAQPNRFNAGPLPWSAGLHNEGFGRSRIFSVSEKECQDGCGVRSAIQHFLGERRNDWEAVHLPCIYGASILWKTSSLSEQQNKWFKGLCEKVEFFSPILATMEWNRLLLLIQDDGHGIEWKNYQLWLHEMSFGYENSTKSAEKLAVLVNKVADPTYHSLWGEVCRMLGEERLYNVGSRLVIFGASRYGLQLYEDLTLAGFTIVRFFDNDPDLVGRKHENVPIESPGPLNDGESVIIASFADRDEIVRQLSAVGGEMKILNWQ